MTPEDVSDDELTAWYQAAIATVASVKRIEVYRLALDKLGDRPAGAQLESFPSPRILNLRQSSLRLSRIESYVSTLMAGTVGRLMRRIQNLDFQDGNQIEHLSIQCWRSVLDCQDLETDRAYAIIVGYLNESDRDEPDETMRRLWLVAYGLLRARRYSRTLSTTAKKLVKKRVLDSKEILRLTSLID